MNTRLTWVVTGSLTAGIVVVLATVAHATGADTAAALNSQVIQASLWGLGLPFAVSAGFIGGLATSSRHSARLLRRAERRLAAAESCAVLLPPLRTAAIPLALVQMPLRRFEPGYPRPN
jgi:hypothetical protein